MADEKIDSIDRPRNASLGVRGISTSKTEKKTAAALKLPVSENAAPSLKDRATYNPFLAFINLIRSIVAFFTGNAKEEAKSAPAVPEQQQPAIPNPTRTASNQLPQSKTITVAPQPEDPKAIIAKQSSDHLFSQLALRYKEEGKARRVFDAVHPAFKARVQKELDKTVDFQKLKEPLIALMINLVLEHETSLQLQEIESNLKAGKLVLNRQEIFKQYPSLEADLKNIPDLAKKFEIMLSRVWIEKALNNLSDYQGTSFEKNILNNLGYNVSSYDDKEFLRAAMKVAFLMPEPPKLEELPKAFKKQAFDIRAMSAGVPAEALFNLRKLLIFCRQNVEELSKQATQNRDALNVDCTSSKGKDIVKDLFHKCNLKLINQQVKTHLENPVLRSQLSKSDPFLESLPPLSVKLNTEIDETIKEVADWFKKYEGMIISEFSQGEDDESLKEGVCLALSHRMATTALNTPDASIDKTAIRSIEPTDRMLQAYHLTRNGKTFGSTLLPSEVLAKNGQKENLIFTAKGEIGVGVGLIKHLSHLEESNGAIYLGWGGHATFMRFDPKRKQFFFFDPNLCTIQFKRGSGESLENLATRMTVAYLELYRWAYPTRDHMHARQFVPLKSGEALPTGKIDLSKVPNYT